MRRLVFAIAFSVAATWSATASAEATPVDIPAEIKSHVPGDLRTYYLAFMVNPATPKAMSSDLFVRHQAYLRRMVEEGRVHLAGPLTDGGRIRGITIISAPSLEDARRLAEGDPAVQEQVLAIELHPAVFPNLKSLTIAYPPKVP